MLFRSLRALGTTLEAGHVVTTGTCIVPVAVGPGDTVVADLGVLGRLSVRLS